MQYTGLLKRIIPFVLTFAVGLFVASFFVTLAFPSMSNWRENRRGRHCRDKQVEVEELREKVRSLRKENEELRRNATDVDAILEDAVPPVEFEHHPPPKKPKHPRHD